jgi:hypothetical protein
MNLKSYLLLALGASILIGCSRDSKDSQMSTYISGQITVDEQLDSSGDYSGIELLVSFQNPDGELRDTVFYAVTDVDGRYSGVARYSERDIYPVIISRNRNTFGVQNMIFADGDSIIFNAQLPNVSQTSELASKENEVYQTLDRVERNFNRVAQFINAGVISADSVDIEINKWSDIYWEIFEKNPGTYAAMIAGNTSVSMLRGWNDSLMIDRSEELLQTEKYLERASRSALIDYYADQGDLNNILQFLDRLERIAESENQKMNIQIDRIEILYDSSRTREANQYLNTFRETYSDNWAAEEWAENIRYDLEFLTPGSPFPEFSFQLINGDSVTTETLSGRPFLIEITRLDNALYQQQYDRTVAIHQIYSNFGLDIITVPLSANFVTLEGFFSERNRLWGFVQPGSYDAEELVETLNLTQVPTRFLVNDRGEIIRRYIGNEYDEIVRGLQQIITQND